MINLQVPDVTDVMKTLHHLRVEWLDGHRFAGKPESE